MNIDSINLREFEQYFLLWILDYIKDHLEEMSLVICEIYNLLQNNELHVLKSAMFSENILPRVGVAKKLYDEYPFFRQIEALDDRYAKEFLKNIENYVFLLLKILKYSPVFSSSTLEDYRKKQIEYINKIIENLLILYKIPIRNMFFNVQENFLGMSYFDLTYQPYGEVCKNGDEQVFYREENIYIDGIFMGDHLKDNNYVSVRVDFYNFVMKGTRQIGCYRNSDNNSLSNFNEAVWDIYMRNLDFDNSKLPSLADLKITKACFPAYSLLVYKKELEVLKKRLKSVESTLEMANNQIKILYELYPKLLFDAESFEEILDGLNGDGVLSISVNKGFEKVKK